MKRSLPSCFGGRLAAVVALAGLLVAGSGQAQPEKYKSADNLTGAEKGKLQDLRVGKASVEGSSPQEKADNLKFLEKAARYYVYRLTDPLYQSGSDRVNMNDVVQDAFRQILVPDPKKPLGAAQQQYMKEFTHALVVSIGKDDIIKNPKPIVRVNAARILARLGEAGQEEAAKLLVEVVKDPNQLDAVKLYAFRGLKELFELGDPDRSIFQDRALETQCLQALEGYILKKRDLPMGATPEEIEGIRYVRREAIRALGKTRFPALSNKGKVEARPALTLLRVARKDGIAPEPGLYERVEAVIGVCQLQPVLFRDWNMDNSAFHVGAVLFDFATAYNNAQAEHPNVPWLTGAVRLLQAVETLRGNAQNTPALDKGMVTYVNRFADAARGAIRPLESKQPPQPAPLQQWLSENAPKATSVYKGAAAKDSEIKPAEGG
jgi:hypothetical protein